jgi:tetratricopeptide (TPR) repeat protein
LLCDSQDDQFFSHQRQQCYLTRNFAKPFSSKGTLQCQDTGDLKIVNRGNAKEVEESMEITPEAEGMYRQRSGGPMTAEMALRLGRPDEAILIAADVLKADDCNLGALETMAKAQWQVNRYSDLLNTLGRLIRINPYEPGYHALRGAALQCLGRYGDSIRAYLRGGDNPGARESAEELRSWQAQLVKSLLENDPVFKAHYTRNPEEACRARGFEFRSESHIRKWVLTDVSARASLVTRPS